MGTRHAASRLGTSRRNIASARSSATRGRPPYFRACTAARAPASSHTAERAACSAAGQSAHNRQGPKCGSGWPQRRHHGGCTGRQRWRQMSHTTRRDVGKENSARHTRHSAGRSSCSSASRTERPVHGGPHHLERCRVAREKARKSSRPLAYQHLAAVLRPYSRRAEHPHPASAPGRVDEVERGAEAWRAAGIERQGVALLQAQGGGVDRDVRVERSPRGFGLGATAARPAGEVAGARGVARQYVELGLDLGGGDGHRAGAASGAHQDPASAVGDRKSTRLNSSHLVISYAVFCLKKKKISRGKTSGAMLDLTYTL